MQVDMHSLLLKKNHFYAGTLNLSLAGPWWLLAWMHSMGGTKLIHGSLGRQHKKSYLLCQLYFIWNLFFACCYIGNELGGQGIGASVDAAQYGKDLIKLKKILNTLYKNTKFKRCCQQVANCRSVMTAIFPLHRGVLRCSKVLTLFRRSKVIWIKNEVNR